MEVLDADQHDLDPPYVYIAVDPKEYFSSPTGEYEGLHIYRLYVLMDPLSDKEWKSLVDDANENPPEDQPKLTVMPATQAIVDQFHDEIIRCWLRMLH